MTTFKLSEKEEVRCTSNHTRSGFCHRATLYVNGEKKASSYISYFNRTWESYQFESVLRKLLEKTKVVPKDTILGVLENWGKDPDLNGMGRLNTIGMVAKLGELFGNTPKEKNDWKKRMLTAGLGDGLILPDDFDGLSEEEKQKRLDGAIGILQEGGRR